jgi:hypothetical protein
MIHDVILAIDGRERMAHGHQLHVITGAQRSQKWHGDGYHEDLGADWLAIEACLELEIPFHGYPAQWRLARERYGKNWRRAGVDRNEWQLRENRDKLMEAHAFHDKISVSTGTKDMVKRLRKADVDVTIHAHS